MIEASILCKLDSFVIDDLSVNLPLLCNPNQVALNKVSPLLVASLTMQKKKKKTIKVGERLFACFPVDTKRVRSEFECKFRMKYRLSDGRQYQSNVTEPFMPHTPPKWNIELKLVESEAHYQVGQPIKTEIQITKSQEASVQHTDQAKLDELTALFQNTSVYDVSAENSAAACLATFLKTNSIASIEPAELNEKVAQANQKSLELLQWWSDDDFQAACDLFAIRIAIHLEHSSGLLCFEPSEINRWNGKTALLNSRMSVYQICTSIPLSTKKLCRFADLERAERLDRLERSGIVPLEGSNGKFVC